MSTELAVIPKETALELYSAPNGLDPIVGKVRAEIDAFLADPNRGDITTAAGRKERASFAYKVAQSKTYLDETGKQLVSDLKQIPVKIDAERKRIRELMDAWKDEIRKPLTDWEEAEKARVATHEQRLASMSFYATGFDGEGSGALVVRLNTVQGYVIDDSWQEFKAKALQAKQNAEVILIAAHRAAVQRESEAAELQRLRDEAAARLRRENEERIAKEAADKARAEAEASAKAAAEKAEREARERLEASERAAKEQREAAERKAKQEKEAAAKREADLKAAQEKAEREKLEAEQRAVRAEKEAKEKAEREQREETERVAKEAMRREADKAHKGKINRTAVAALMDGGMSEETAKQAITLIAGKKIPNVTIAY